MIITIIFTACFVAILAFFHRFFVSPYLKMQKYKENGGENIYFFPILGIMYYMFRDFKKKNDSLHFMKEFAKKYPNSKYLISNWWSNLYIIPIDPEFIKDLVVKNIMKTRADHTHAFDHILSDQNIVFSEGEGWKNRRKLHSFGFTFENVKKFTPIMVEITDKYLSEMSNEAKTGKVNLILHLYSITGDFIQRAVLGAKTQDVKIEGMNLVNYQFYIAEFMFQRMLTLPYLIFGKKYYDNALFGKEKRINNKAGELRKVVDLEVEKAKIEWKNNAPGKELKLLDYLIENMEKNKNLKESNISLTSEFLMLVGAGVETTSHYILNCLILLNNHPEVLKKLKEEIDTNLKNDDDYNFDKINSLPYLTAFIKECLRMGHPLPLGLMKQLEVDCILDGVSFPKNTIFLNGLALNFVKEKYFPNADKFDPERWLKDGIVQDDPSSFIPFSIGPRNCIGAQFAQMESKVLVARFLQKFDFNVLTKEIQWRFAVTYGPFNPVLFQLKEL